MTKDKLKKILITIFVIFAIFTVIFYFLVGEQIKYKDSNKNIKMVEADTTTVELVEGITIEQTFTNDLEYIDSIAIVGHTYWRENNQGILTIELLHDGYVLIHQDVDISDVPEQHRLYLKLNDSISEMQGEEFTIKLSSTSEEGHGICFMSCSTNNIGGLYINGDSEEGSICFETTGREKVLFGEYYWPIAILLNVCVIVILLISYRRYMRGKKDYIISIIFAIVRYKFLISQLVSRDFKSKYKRSVLGILWSLLNPLLTMTVQFLVFSTIFHADTKSYPVYLLSGVVCYSFFKEATDMCLISISSNANLVNKVYIPKYIFPLARTISSTINLGLSLVPLMIVTIIMGIKLNATVLLMFYFLACLIIFSLGIGMFLSSLMVFFRDIQFLWSVIVQAWQYATPIFYTAEIIPEKYRFIIKFNPLYHFIGNLRKCLMEGVSPEPSAYLYCLLFALISLGIGTFVFKKTQDKFTLYL